MNVSGIGGMNGNGGVAGVSGAIGGSVGIGGAGAANDAVSRDLQNQIKAKQDELKSLAERDNLSPEEKQKKRQELQKEISTLRTELRQHEIETRREKTGSGETVEDLLGGGQKAKRKHGANAAGNGKSASGKTGGVKSAGMSAAGMQAFISADMSMKQVDAQGGVKTAMEGKAGVLEVEIKLDKGRGGNVAKKEEELVSTEQKIADATAGQMSALGDVRETLRDAAEEETDFAEDRANETGRADNDEDEADKTKSEVTSSNEKTIANEESGKNSVENPLGNYVDIVL